MNATMDYSERLTRHCLSELPDGEATFTDWIDDDQIDVGKPIPLVCTVRKRGDAMEVDWTGSAPQVKGAINNTWSYTAAMSFTAVKSVLSINMPNNDGVFRPIKVIAPPGTITHGKLPAACAARGLTGFRGVDCCFGALAQLYPDRVYARVATAATPASRSAATTRTLRPFIYVDFLSGCWGARPWADGLDGNTSMFANMASFSVEVIEAENPLEVLDYEFVPDTGGAGQVPRRHVAAQDLADAGRRGHPAGARRPADASAVRSGTAAVRARRGATCWTRDCRPSRSCTPN